MLRISGYLFRSDSSNLLSEFSLRFHKTNASKLNTFYSLVGSIRKKCKKAFHKNSHISYLYDKHGLCKWLGGWFDYLQSECYRLCCLGEQWKDQSFHVGETGTSSLIFIQWSQQLQTRDSLNIEKNIEKFIRISQKNWLKRHFANCYQ